MVDNNILLPIQDSISTAWQRVRGAKGTIWAAIGMLVLVAIGFCILTYIGKAILPASKPVINFIGQIFNFLLQLGLLYIGIKRALDLPIRYTMVFHALNLALAAKLILLYILETIIMLPVALIFLILPSMLIVVPHSPDALRLVVAFCYLIGIIGMIYLMIRMILALAFVLDKNMGAWDAIKSSFAATKKNVWRLIGIVIVKICAILLGVITLGIGLIWAIPFVTILYGVIYTKLRANAQA